MEFVEPIYHKKKITQIKNQLEGVKRYRDLLLFVVGINTALRISDLLQLTLGQFIDEQGNIRDKFSIREEKREKRNQIVINTNIREALQKYLSAYPEVGNSADYFLFFSSRRNGPDFSKPISRIQAWRIIAEVCKLVGLVGNFGTHTLRKTWGYHAWQSGVPLELIMAKLNHSNIAMTKRYLGITDDELRLIAEGLNL
jgi:integrase